MSDDRYTAEDNYVKKYLLRHNIPSPVVDSVVQLISNTRHSDRHKYLNIEYLAVACYGLITNDMSIDESCLRVLARDIIRASDIDTSVRSLTRYSLFIIRFSML